jgi:RecA-family ATPase
MKGEYIVDCVCCGLPGIFSTKGGYQCGRGKRSWVDGRNLWKNQKLKRRAVPIPELMNRPPTGWLIRDHLPQAASVLHYGESGIGKSFLMLDESLSLAYGVPYGVNDVPQPGKVAYIYSEGDGGLKLRVKAWLLHHNIPFDDDRWKNISFICASFNLSLDSERDQLVEIVERDLGSKPDLVVIDTLARNIGVGENDQMQTMVDAAEDLQIRFAKTARATVAMVHHIGKDASKGPRGGSQLQCGVDYINRLSGILEDGKYVAITVTNEKNKDGEPLEPYILDFHKISFSEERHDSSLVLVPSERKPITGDNRKHTRLLYDCIRMWKHVPHSDQPGLSKIDMKDHAIHTLELENSFLLPNEKPKSISDDRVKAVWKFLKEQKLIEIDPTQKTKNENHAKWRKSSDSYVDFFTRYGCGDSS